MTNTARSRIIESSAKTSEILSPEISGRARGRNLTSIRPRLRQKKEKRARPCHPRKLQRPSLMFNYSSSYGRIGQWKLRVCRYNSGSTIYDTNNLITMVQVCSSYPVNYKRFPAVGPRSIPPLKDIGEKKENRLGRIKQERRKDKIFRDELMLVVLLGML